MSENTLRNPFTKGDQVRLPAGTIVHTMHPSRHSYTLRRAQTITVHHTSDGYVNVFDRRGFGQTVLPELTWAGTGGYWNRVQVTPELCVINEVAIPKLPDSDAYGISRLDTAPSYDYSNAWAA